MVSVCIQLFCSFREKTGVHAGDLFMSFKSIFQDVRSAMDHVHIYGDLQNETVAVSKVFQKYTRALEANVRFFFINRIWTNMWKRIRVFQWCCPVFVSRARNVSCWPTAHSISPTESWLICSISHTEASPRSHTARGLRTSISLLWMQRNHFSLAKEPFWDK